MRNLEEFNQKYASKTAFVIGSGPSLNSQDLTPLKDFVTIAVNSAYLAFPNSDYFLSDDWSCARWSYYMEDLRYSLTIPLLYEKMLWDQTAYFGDRAVLFRHRTGYHITDKYEHNNRENHICQARTSVGSAIHVAHIMGCSNIVLLGVDCCRTDSLRHFWQDRGKKKPRRLDGLPVDPHRRTTFEGQQSDTDLIDITRYWRDKAPFFLEKCKVFNASPVSALTVFPKVNLVQFIADNQEGKKDV